MKTEDVALGFLVLMFAVILFGDGILAAFNPDGMLLSSNDVKGIAGFTFLLISLWIFIKSKEK